MMYRLKSEHKNLTEDQQHDLWILIRQLEGTPEISPNCLSDRFLAKSMLDKYFEEDK